MKKPLLLLFALAVGLNLFAQPSGPQLHGIVTQQNSSNTALDGVQVSGSWASPTASLSDGTFSLTFFDIGPGEGIHVEANKSGWEIVNEREMQTRVPKVAQVRPFKIVMAPLGQLAASRIEYYNISREVITQKYERQIARLNKQQEGWEAEKSELEERYQEQLKYARSLAEKFARTNFDDVSDLYEKAFGMYKRGQIDSALQVLEAADLLIRAANRLAERENIDSLRRGLDERQAENEAGILEDMEAIELAAELYAINYENDKAVSMYEQLIALDSTNLDNMLGAAEFFKERKYYDRAISLYERLKEKPIELWQKGNVSAYIGELKTEIGQLSLVLPEYHRFKNIYRSLVEQDTANVFYRSNLAISYSRLGETYASLGQLDSALWYYKQDLGITKELSVSNPRSEGLKNGLAISYSKLGTTYASLGQLDSALWYYKQDLGITKELSVSNPRSESLKHGLAISYTRLGETYGSLGQLDSALWYYREFNQLTKELSVSNPRSERLKNGLAISYEKLGETYATLGQLDSALWYYTIETDLFEELSVSNSRSERLKNGLAISYSRLGETYASLGQLDSALWYYKQDLGITKELSVSNPRSVDLLFGLGVSYYKLGTVYAATDQLLSAKENYMEAAQIFNRVYDITGVEKYLGKVQYLEGEIIMLEE